MFPLLFKTAFIKNGLVLSRYSDFYDKMVTMSISTQDIQQNGSVDMATILREVRHNVLPNAGLTYKLRYLGDNIWTIRIRHPNAVRSARIEVVVDEYTNPEDRGARGAVFTYGDIQRNDITLIMNSLMERL
jgi:hypothetical protein